MKTIPSQHPAYAPYWHALSCMVTLGLTTSCAVSANEVTNEDRAGATKQSLLDPYICDASKTVVKSHFDNPNIEVGDDFVIEACWDEDPADPVVEINGVFNNTTGTLVSEIRSALSVPQTFYFFCGPGFLLAPQLGPPADWQCDRTPDDGNDHHPGFLRLNVQPDFDLDSVRPSSWPSALVPHDWPLPLPFEINLYTESSGQEIAATVTYWIDINMSVRTNAPGNKVVTGGDPFTLTVEWQNETGAALRVLEGDAIGIPLGNISHTTQDAENCIFGPMDTTSPFYTPTIAPFSSHYRCVTGTNETPLQTPMFFQVTPPDIDALQVVKQVQIDAYLEELTVEEPTHLYSMKRMPLEAPYTLNLPFLIR